MFRGIRVGLTSLRRLGAPGALPCAQLCSAAPPAGALGAAGEAQDAAPAPGRPLAPAGGDRSVASLLGPWQAARQSRRAQDGPAGRRVHSGPQAAQPPQGFAPAAAEDDKVAAKAQVIFDTCWRRLEGRMEGRLQVPKEIVWLNGAPGSGKGVNTPFILESRGLTRAVSISSLFQETPDIRQFVDRGELVPDTMVGDALLDTIFEADADPAGLVIDGFPRTALQVEILKLLFDKMQQLHMSRADGPEEWRFPRPSFKIVVLYVEADESIKRQLTRARQASLHNRRVLDAGTGSLQDVRPTDEDIVKCRRRYEVFKAHYGTLLRLKQYFPFSLIDAMGSLEDCRAQIAQELRYQSSMDLEEATYSAIRHLPLAKELVRTSRQQLVSHLDAYCRKHRGLFAKVIRVIDEEALPVLKRCSLAGHAELKTHNPLFSEAPLAADMLMDILTDRGFSTAYFVDEQIVPFRVDLQTGAISSRIENVHHFRITFESAKVRAVASGGGAAATEAKAAEPMRVGVGIGGSCVPSHWDHQKPRPNFGAPAAAAC